MDVPVAGRGYSVLPFIFDLINVLNGTKIADSTAKAPKDRLAKDPDGVGTEQQLRSVLRIVSRITGKEPESLGLHPVVYFYTRGGAFSPWAFLAWSLIVNEIYDKGSANAFCGVRPNLEKYLIENKWAMTEIIHKNGSGHRSTPWLARYWRFVLSEFLAGKGYDTVTNSVLEKFEFLKFKTPVIRLPGETSSKKISSNTKTAAIWDAALPGAPRCEICGGIWHRNSIHGDHRIAKRDGGDGRSSNVGITHPYCDSAYKDFLARNALKASVAG